MSFDLTRKTAVVTGATSGIGLATATRLAAGGARVVVGFHSDAAQAARVAAALPGSGHVALPMAIDDAASLAAAAERIAEQLGAVDVLVNAAGRSTTVPARDLAALTDDIFDEITKVNLRGPFAVIRTLLPLLQASPEAVIVNIGSVAALTGVGSNLAYCAAKAGVHALTVALAKILGPGIRVVTVSPGAVDTGFVRGRAPGALDKIAEGTPLKKVTSAGAVADAVLACVVQLTSSTGIEVRVDEGRHLP
ncbi:SDR family NAD(P)-dependent oxidoreductase [Rhodoplanes azumiensis]|uniref:SDR family NAD(P)-dependent oxidoreductase n=1 Tax=Rhodoplanes azumiensis TaxID=1897628 RepID=A0ABW5AHQ8_9BRAD